MKLPRRRKPRIDATRAQGIAEAHVLMRSIKDTVVEEVGRGAEGWGVSFQIPGCLYVDVIVKDNGEVVIGETL